MADRKASFAKRQRETELKDRAVQKRAAAIKRRSEVRNTKGPEIAWDEAVHAVAASGDDVPSDPASQDDQADGDSTGTVTPENTAPRDDELPG